MAKSTTYTYEPDFVTPPGDTLLELLQEREISQSELARRMNRPIKTINEIIRAKKEVTAETALQLELVLGTPAHVWLNLEQNYQEHLARRAANEALQAEQGWLDNFPVKDMQGWGWLPEVAGKAQLLVALLQFFGIAEPASWNDLWSDSLVNFRRTAAYASSEYALSAWLRQGEIQAQDVSCAPYDDAQFRNLLQKEIRALTCLSPEDFEASLVTLCASVGVAVVFVPQIAGARVSGATRWLTKDKALLQLSLRYKTNDHFWFTFFHEAAHILLHGKRDVFIDEDNGAATEKEQQADRFAANTLVPPQAYKAFVSAQTRLSKQAVSQFAETLGIAPGIVVGRLQHDGHLRYTHLNGLKERFTWTDST
ncbi:MAG: HigA family addiction module antidote protein [Anaerolineales bacterium]|nr:HigA family addiction module antidote protein [Anaerolineales bacterium]